MAAAFMAAIELAYSGRSNANGEPGLPSPNKRRLNGKLQTDL